jgi:diguanylate cyclase (GGDEF)-like protein
VALGGCRDDPGAPLTGQRPAWLDRLRRPRPDQRPARRKVRLWTCLVGLVLVPILALTTLATATSVRRAAVARKAAILERHTAALVDVFRLGFQVVDEATVAQAMLVIPTLGVSAQELESKIGVDIQVRWREAPRLTDVALQALPETTWVVQVATALRVARGNAAAGRLSPADLARYAWVQQTIKQNTLELLNQVEAGGNELSDDGAANGAAERSRAAYEALLAATDEAPLFFAVYLSGDPSLARQQLAAAQQRYTLFLAELGRRDAARLGSVWTAVTTDPLAARFDQAVTRLLGSRPDQPAALAAVGGPTYVAGQRRIGVLRQLVERSIVDLEHQTHNRAATARASLWTSVAGTILIWLLTLLGAWLVTRMIARPLRALADRARQVNDGELDVPPVAEHGVREVVEVTHVFNDMVRNLGLLGRQAEALASGDLSDSSLTGSLPGALGRSLHGSVERLSESLQARDMLADRLRHEATHDKLTGLLNRAAATVSLERAVGRARRTGEQLVVLVVDLDGVKAINSSHGQRSGDQLLVGCARRFMTVARDSDTLARLDSDEFVLIADVPDVATAVGLAERVRAAVSDPILVEGVELKVTASVGLAVNMDNTDSADTLLRDAEAAVRRAKAGGGDRVEIFDTDLRQQLAEQDAIERALALALANDLLELHYQPILDTASGELAGFEALCRWTDPELGSVAPDRFIAAAERSDLIIELDRWVLGRATRQLAAWQREQQLDVHVSVNISGRHLLRGDIVADVRQALAASGVVPSSLVIEITETVLLVDLVKVADSLSALRRLGVRVALDDFGTGYTSIAHLRQLPVDILKIDRSLISQVEHGQDGLLVGLLVQIARTLGLGMVAEGAEQPGQLSELRSMNCEQVQGYLLGRPMPAAAVDEWLGQHRPARTEV